MFLYEVLDQFEQLKLKSVIVGGYALALQDIIRATVDIDFVLQLSEEDFVKAESALNKLGLVSRLPVTASEVFKMRKEFIKNRNLIAWSFVDPRNPLRQVDLLITKDLRDIKTNKVSVAGRKVVVATLEELLKMKKESNRPQDQTDITLIKAKLNEKKD